LADTEVAGDWIEEVSAALFRFDDPSDIFNLDEYGANMAGTEKTPLLVIG
jgi:hypothetical protein